MEFFMSLKKMKIIRNQTEYKDLMKPGSFIGCVLTASGIKNAVIIFHGVLGCNIEAVHFRSDQIPGGAYVPVVPTGINEADCIQGGNEKLLATLRNTINQSLARKKKPDAVFVITSDAPSIVGDDIQNCAKIVEQETGVKIIAVDSPGFAGGVSSGTDIFLTKLIQKYLQEGSKPDNKSVNIVAPYLMGSKNWNNDIDEIIRMLQASDISVNLNLCRNLDMQNLGKITNAGFNYILASDELKNFEALCSKASLQTIGDSLPLPIGIANTEEWVLAFAEKVGDIEKAKKFLKLEQKFVQSQLRFNYNFSWMSTLMYSKRCSILANACFGASLARSLIWDFGIIPKVIGLYAETERTEQKALALLEPIKHQADFTVLINPSYFEYANYIKKSNIDFSIGSIQDKPLSLGLKIPHLCLSGYNFFNQYNFIPWPIMGIRGILGLLSELSRIMEESFYLNDVIALNAFQPKV